MESRHSTYEREKGSPNGTDSFPVDRSAFAPNGAPSSGAASQLLVVDERPLSAEDCALGEVVAGKYLIEGVIGRGSMGVVVRATHLGFDELVAVKFIRPEMRELDGIVSRFAREAKASVRIRNQHAVNVLDVGVAEPIGPFFVMEYLEGINLEELVDSQGAFDAPTAVRYVLEACEALAAAHAQGIIHRDIKPQNMFLAWQGRLEVIKLLDFGISKAALSGQIFGDDLSIREKDWVMGTPLYMSPEQLRHAPDVDERTDIWSLGAVLYELLCGQPLFSGDTQTAVCRQVLEVNSQPVRVAVPGVPEALWDVIERCLSQDKEQRYPNVAELGEALLPFAPAGVCLHVERARALLGLRPLDFFGSYSDIEDSDIEDIDVEPIDEGDAHAAGSLPSHSGRAGGSQPAAPPTPPAPPRARGPYWVELAVPALACAIFFIALHQWQLAQEASALRVEAVQTEVLALRARAECPAPAPNGAAATNGSATPRAAPPQTPAANAGGSALPGSETSDDAVVEQTAGVDTSGTPDDSRNDSAGSGSDSSGSDNGGAAAAAAPAGDAARSEAGARAVAAAPVPAARPRPTNGVRSVPTAGTIGSPASVTAREVAPDPGVPATSAPSAPAPAPSHARPVARRPLEPKPKTEPKLEFKLIDEQPADIGLVPDTERRASTPPAP